MPPPLMGEFTPPSPPPSTGGGIYPPLPSTPYRYLENPATQTYTLHIYTMYIYYLCTLCMYILYLDYTDRLCMCIMVWQMLQLYKFLIFLISTLRNFFIIYVMNQGNMSIKYISTFSNKIRFKPIGHYILVPKIMHPHNYASALRIFLKFPHLKKRRGKSKLY